MPTGHGAFLTRQRYLTLLNIPFWPKRPITNAFAVRPDSSDPEAVGRQELSAILFVILFVEGITKAA
jgi:hypothetical protein